MADEREGLARELQSLEAELKRLEAEYNMFFAGRLPRPPWETRSRVDAIVKRLDTAAATGGAGAVQGWCVDGLTRHTACVERGDSGGANISTGGFALGLTSGASLPATASA